MLDEARFNVDLDGMNICRYKQGTLVVPFYGSDAD